MSIRVELVYASPDPGNGILDETLTIPAGEAHEYQDLFEESVGKKLTITTADGQRVHHEWEAGTYPGGGYISVRITGDKIEVGHASA